MDIAEYVGRCEERLDRWDFQIAVEASQAEQRWVIIVMDFVAGSGFSYENSSFTEIRLAEMSSMGIGSKPCLDIRPSKDQINDRSISVSQLGNYHWHYKRLSMVAAIKIWLK